MENNVHIEKYKSYPAGSVDYRITYLAGPYSHQNPEIQNDRIEKLREAALILTRRGLNIFSPINYTHIFESANCEPRFGYYHFCMAYVRQSHQMIILKLDGWDKSFGVAEEIKRSPTIRYSY